jgi:hypothetical protein
VSAAFANISALPREVPLIVVTLHKIINCNHCGRQKIEYLITHQWHFDQEGSPVCSYSIERVVRQIHTLSRINRHDLT